MTISILVADSKASSRSDLVAQLQKDRTLDVVSEVSDARAVLDSARQQRPSIIILDGSLAGMDVVNLVTELQSSVPESGIIVLIDSADMEVVRRLMRAGANDYLIKPAQPEDLLNAVRGVYETVQKTRVGVTTQQNPENGKGRVIAVYSPQGGAGKSMLAANLGVALAQALDAKNTPGQVALIDLNLQFGDIDLMLNLNPENTIAGLAQKGHVGLDSELVEQYLTTHEESGLKVLVAPSTPQHAESITVYVVEQVIEALRDSYQYVIVDTPAQLQDTTLAALDFATSILLLTTLDLLALHKTRIALDMLRQLYTPERIWLVLNRANSDVGISLNDVETTLEVKMRAQIPSDGRIVVTSVNEGKPFVTGAPHTQIAQRIEALAYEIMGREAPTETQSAPQSNSILKKWFS
ncbi:MAG TPA: response regulator [Abditibacteriaceae bacterium]|jgi:pilus assembly protein CpaE